MKSGDVVPRNGGSCKTPSKQGSRFGLDSEPDENAVRPGQRGIVAVTSSVRSSMLSTAMFSLATGVQSILLEGRSGLDDREEFLGGGLGPVEGEDQGGVGHGASGKDGGVGGSGTGWKSVEEIFEEVGDSVEVRIPARSRVRIVRTAEERMSAIGRMRECRA